VICTLESHQGRPAAGAQLNELKVRAMVLAGTLDRRWAARDRSCSGEFWDPENGSSPKYRILLTPQNPFVLPHLGIAPAAVSSVTSNTLIIV